MNYRYREGELIAEFQKYIDSTYQQHYVTDGKQTMDSIIANGHGTGFCLGNVDKYKDRYGKKGETPNEWRKDLIKVMHYTLFQLFIHDKEHAAASERDIVQRELALDLPNPIAGDGVDWNHIPETQLMTELDIADKNMHNKSIDDASPEEWDNVAKKIWSGRPTYPNEL